jgi:TRAP transporter 4TM/12TM fusion protein
MSRLNAVLGGALTLFVLAEVNYPQFGPQAQLSLFALLGSVLCYLNVPAHPRLADRPAARRVDRGLAVLAALTFGYVVVQTEDLFRFLWVDGQELGERAGLETALDTTVGAIGLLLVLEAARRTLGWALPLLSTAFLLYAVWGAHMPAWLFPHRGYGGERIVAQTFLHSQGVFGMAMNVMFTYVFLFVVFGAVLRQTGATRFIIDFAQRTLGGTPGGPAKVSVLSSGLMGSLSGSAVANTATTGTFTIPMMKGSGFRPHVAGGVEAAASTGGALVPPVMGAGAYMMLEIVEPPVTYLEIIRAALIPAVLYYVALLLIVHLYAKRLGLGRERQAASDRTPLVRFEGLVFVAGITTLVALLIAGYTVFRAASIALVVVLGVSALRARTRVGPRRILQALTDSARDAVPLITAAACVGIVIGVVTLTGLGTKLPATVLGLAQGNLIGALALIMVSSIVLGMGMPSAVCYLLLATLIGPVLGNLGVVPLAAHLFVFYFGMMSMVTPPVALAAYAAASIAGSGIMATGLAAFRFALVGFTLPYMFVLRPELLMLAPDGGPAPAAVVLPALLLALTGTVPLAAGIAGHLLGPLSLPVRVVALAAAAALLFPNTWSPGGIPVLGGVGLVLLSGVALAGRRAATRGAGPVPLD